MNQPEYDKDRPVIIFTENIWRKAIKNKLVDCTEEQLDQAVKGNGIIAVGNLPGSGVVNMCVDRFSVEVKGNLEAGYLKKE